MSLHSLQIHYQEYESEEALPPEDRQLLQVARQAASRAYAPYSRFHVGAAVLLANGTIVSGNNQENAAFPSGLCAERVALFAASSQHPGVAMLAIAITARAENQKLDTPVTPCGACRQVMAEYEINLNQPLRVIMAGKSGKIIVTDTAAGLLPFVFTSKNLSNES